MRILHLIVVVLSAVILFITPVKASAHGTDKHGKAESGDDHINKLHAMMPMFSMAAAELEIALEKNDVVSVDSEAGKILAAIPDLKKSSPHKNIKQRKKYVDLATRLEKAVNTVVDLSKKGDLAGATKAFKKVEEVCAACHAKFRD